MVPIFPTWLLLNISVFYSSKSFFKLCSSSSLIFVFFSFQQQIQYQFQQFKLKKHRLYAWNLNPGPQNGRRRRNHRAMAATQHIQNQFYKYVPCRLAAKVDLRECFYLNAAIHDLVAQKLISTNSFCNSSTTTDADVATAACKSAKFCKLFSQQIRYVTAVVGAVAASMAASGSNPAPQNQTKWYKSPCPSTLR